MIFFVASFVAKTWQLIQVDSDLNSFVRLGYSDTLCSLIFPGGDGRFFFWFCRERRLLVAFVHLFGSFEHFVSVPGPSVGFIIWCKVLGRLGF